MPAAAIGSVTRTLMPRRRARTAPDAGTQLESTMAGLEQLDLERREAAHDVAGLDRAERADAQDPALSSPWPPATVMP